MMLRSTSIRPYFFIIIATLLLYLWQFHLYPMINPDGVTYIQAAAAFAHGGVHAVLAVNDQAKWPFYSIMIALIHNISGFDIYLSQKILDGIFIAISSILFLYIVRLFSQHRFSSFWAIVVWLAWHEYVKWWPIVVRDQGFITCLLLSFCCFYHFILGRKFRWALAWSCCLFLAELFRIEAAIYLFLVPFSVFFLFKETKSSRFLRWLQLNTLVFAAVFCVVALFVMHILKLNSLRFAYMWQELTTYFSSTDIEFTSRLDVMKHHVFYRENPYPAYTLVAGYIMLFLCYVIGQVTFAVLPPLLFARRVLHQLNALMFRSCFIVYCGVTLMLPLLFFVEYAFLNGRYLLPFGLFVCLMTASILPHVIDSFSGKNKKFFITIIVLLFLMNFVASIFSFGHRTQDEKDVGLWMKQNYPYQTIFTDTKRILFYASDAPDYRRGDMREMWLHGILGTGAIWLREHDSWCQYDFLVLTPPPGKTSSDYALYENLERQGALGPIVKTFTRKANGEHILIAAIDHQGCEKFVQKTIKNG